MKMFNKTKIKNDDMIYYVWKKEKKLEEKEKGKEEVIPTYVF